MNLAFFLKTIINLLLISLIGFSLAIVFFWRYPWELFTNFRVYYFFLSFLLTLFFFLVCFKGYRWQIPLYLSLALLVLNSAWILPWYFPNSHQGPGKSLRVLEFNINGQNSDWEAIAAKVQEAEPELAIIIEVSSEAMEELEQRLQPEWSFSYRSTGGGLAVFSKQELINPHSLTLHQDTILVTNFLLKEQEVQLIAFHPLIPLFKDLFTRRNRELAEVTAYIQNHFNKPLILVGDFNLTPWSPYYRRLITKTGLHNTRLGFGVEPSWIEQATHVHLPTWLTTVVKIPIDHILVSKEFSVSNCQTIRGGNSDHRLLISDLDWR